MSEICESKRITFKHTRPNPLFQEWLENLLEEAREKNSRLKTMLEGALNSLSKYPLPLKTGAECAILQGFDKKLCKLLDMRLEVYNSNLQLASVSTAAQQELSSQVSDGSSNDSTSETQKEGRKRIISDTTSSSNSNESKEDDQTNPMPQSSAAKIPKLSQEGSVSNADSQDVASCNTNVLGGKTKKPTGCKEYKPAFQSGSYAILVTLLEHSKENPSKPSLTKEELIEKAQIHCEESFVRAKPESFYTAWSIMSKLVTKNLVVKTRHKKVEYSLTDLGKALATEILLENDKRPTVNDIIFNGASSSTDIEETGSIDNTVMTPRLESLTDIEVSEMVAGTFDIILLIDKNETSGVSKKNDPTVAQFKKYPDLKHEYRSLKVGDFTWIARHKVNKELELVLPYIIERKRMDDLGASVKDGRFQEQKFRLRKCGLPNVIYLVESYGRNKHVGLPLQALMQALANTRVQDGFKVHTTNSLTNSARFLAMMTKRLTIEYKDKNLKGSNNLPTGERLMTFEYFNKASAKTKPITVTEAFIKTLLQLKGMSVEKALAITKEYRTPRSLIQAYENCPGDDGHFLLAQLKYGNLNRNIGPNISKSIYHVFNKPR